MLLSSQINTEDILYDDSWIVPTKAAHDASFDAFVANGKLCSLNATKLLEDKDFGKMPRNIGRASIKDRASVVVEPSALIARRKSSAGKA